MIRPSARVLAVTLLVLLLAPLVPAGALHVAEPPTVPERPERQRLDLETGVVVVDERLRELEDEIDARIAAFDEEVRQAYGEAIAATRPVRPVELYHDDVGPGERYGGIATWVEGPDWYRRPPLEEGEGWTWWFADPETGAYPATDDALLLSPLIELDTLGRNTDLLPGWRTTNGSLLLDGGEPLDLFTLVLKHRFSFAHLSSIQQGLDGGRVELFLDLSPASYEAGGVVLSPIAGTTGYAPFVRAFEGPAFSGTSNWTLSAFDLTPWAGHVVRVGFRVSTIAFSNQEAYFADETLFPTDAPRGWFLDELSVHAPALPHRLKVEPLRSPGPVHPESGVIEVPPDRAVEVRTPVVNLGSEPERVRVTTSVLSAGRETGQPESVLYTRSREFSLDPGGVFNLTDRGWDAKLPPGERAAWISVTAQRLEGPGRVGPVEPLARALVPIHVTSRQEVDADLSVTPTVGPAGTPREVRLSVTNLGNQPVFLPVALELRDADRGELPDGWADPPPDATRHLTVAPGATGTLTWTVTPAREGRFAVAARLGGSPDGELPLQEDWSEPDALTRWTSEDAGGPSRWERHAGVWETPVVGVKDYGAGESDTLVSPPIPLMGLVEPVLTFSSWMEGERGCSLGLCTTRDHGRVEVSADGGETWRTLLDGHWRTDWWEEVTLDLGPEAGRSVLLRFSFLSDDANHGEGWYLDDVRVASALHRVHAGIFSGISPVPEPNATALEADRFRPMPGGCETNVNYTCERPYTPELAGGGYWSPAGTLDDAMWLAGDFTHALVGRPAFRYGDCGLPVVSEAVTGTTDPQALATCTLDGLQGEGSDLVPASLVTAIEEVAFEGRDVQDVLLRAHANLTLDVRYWTLRNDIKLQLLFARTGPTTGLLDSAALVAPIEESVVVVDVPLRGDNGSSAAGWLPVKMREGWRTVHLDLDPYVRAVTGTTNAWDLLLSEVRVESRERNSILIDDLRVRGVPLAAPERGAVTLLRATGDPTTEIGTWQVRQSVRPCIDTQSNPSQQTCWKRGHTVELQASSLSGSWWTTEEVNGTVVWRMRPFLSGGSPVREQDDQRLITPPVVIANATDPVLVLDHAFATPGSTFGISGVSQDSYEITQVYVVSAQYLMGDGNWSAFYPLTPEGGYPEPELSTPLGTPRFPKQGPQLWPGDGFYWPKGEILYFDADLGASRSFHSPGSQDRQDVFRLNDAPGGTGLPVPLEGRTVRFAFHAVMKPTCGATNPQLSFCPLQDPDWSYWNITTWTVRDQPRLTHDVAVTDGRLEPAYALDLPGFKRALGPNTHVPLVVTVENRGLLDQPRAELTVEVREVGGATDLLTTTFPLAAGATTTQRLDWTVPEHVEGRTFRFTARVELEPRPDLAPQDNERVLGEFVVKTRERIGVHTEVSPTTAAADVPFTLRTLLDNPGNVPLHDVRVVRTISRLGESPVVVRQDLWDLDGPLSPLASPASLTGRTVRTTHASSPPDQAPDRWVPGSPGTYGIETRVEAYSDEVREARDEPGLVEVHSTVINAVHTLFRDDFEGGRAGGLPGSDWIADDAWSRPADRGFRSRTAWWIGAGEAGYDDGVDASLTSPTIDLTSAKSAFLSIATNYSTEPFYDGGIVEISPDGGKTWHPLVPGSNQGLAGYPSEISPSNPVVPDGDPLRAPGALSGRIPLDERVEGWQLLTFPLEQVEELVRREVVADLVPPEKDNGTLTRTGAQFSRDSWTLGTGSQGLRFAVYNGTVAQPSPRTGGVMWYTGSRLDKDLSVHTRLPLSASAPAGANLVVEFLDWRPGTTLRDRNGTGGTFTVTATGTPDVTTTVHTPKEQDDPAWTLRRAYVNRTDLSVPLTAEVVFEYRSVACRAESATCDRSPQGIRAVANLTDNRGWAVDNVTLARTTGSGAIIPFEEDLQETGEARWGTPENLVPDTPTAPVWAPASTGVQVPGSWSARVPPADLAARDNPLPAWVLAPGKGAIGLPANTDSRLVGPLVDLRGALGSEITLRLEHQFNFQLRDRWVSGTNVTGSPIVEGGAIEVQVFNETTGGFDPWRQLFKEPLKASDIVLRAVDLNDNGFTDCIHENGNDHYPSAEAVPLWWGKDCVVYPLPATLKDEGLKHAVGYTTAVQGMGLPFEEFRIKVEHLDLFRLDERDQDFAFLYSGNSDGIRKETFNLSWLAGKRFRIGLHAWANPHEPTSFTPEHWIVHDLRIETEVFEARRVAFRFHFGSDDSVPGEGWGIDDVKLGAVAYDRNLALELDPASVPESLAPGSAVWLNGTLLNRGTAARSGVGVRLEQEGTAIGLKWAPGASLERADLRDLPHVVGPFSLGPGGSAGDTVPFALRMVVPENVLNRTVNMTVRLVEVLERLDPTSGERPLNRLLTDQVAGNKRERFEVRVGSFPELEPSLMVRPDRVGVGERARIHVNLTNAGTLPLEPNVFVNVTREDGAPVLTESRRLDLPLGNGAASLTLSFTPERVGNHTIRVEAVAEGIRRSNATTLPVDRATSLLSTSWEHAADWALWDRYAVPEKERCANVRANDGQSPPRPGAPSWARHNGTSVAGDHAAVFGEPDTSLGRPPAFQDAALESPPIDLGKLEAPTLTVVHRPRFVTPGAGSVLELQVLDRDTGRALYTEDANCRNANTRLPNKGGWFMLTPEGGYTHTTVSDPGVPPTEQGQSTPSNLSPLGQGHPVFGGTPGTWRQSIFALDAQGLRVPGTNKPIDLAEHVVRLRLRATTMELVTQRGEGWDVDNLVLSDSSIRLSPRVLSADIVDGATKRFTLAVQNPGTTTDRYRVEIVEGGTNLPRDWLRLLTPALDVPSGGSGAAEIEVRVPISEDNKAATYALVLSVSSVFDPGIVALSSMRITVVPSLHANLAGKLLGVEGGELQVGTPTVLAANVLNTGLVPSNPATVRFWYEAPGSSERTTIETASLPPVPAGSRGTPGSAQLTANFTTPTEPVGPYLLGITIDPLARVIEYDETDNEATLPVRVVPLQRPDLAVGQEDFVVLDLQGAPLEAANAGDLVQVLARVTNEGNQAARNVQVTLSLGASPAGHRVLSSLGPGATQAFRFTLFAPAESARLTLNVKTLDVELSDENNEAQVALLVQTPQFEVRLEDPPLALGPGPPTPVTLVLENVGNAASLVSVSLGGEGLSGTLEPAEVFLSPGRVVTLEALVTVHPTLTPGETELELLVDPLDGRGSQTLRLPITVRETTDVSLHGDGLLAVPGEVTLPITIENRGNRLESLDVQLELPEGWRASVPGIQALEAGRTRSLELGLVVPNATAPGAYSVRIRAVGDGGLDERLDVPVTIRPIARAALEARPVQLGTRPVIYDLALTNTGNVPASLAFVMDRTPEGWTVEIDQTPDVLEPGESTVAKTLFTPTRTSSAQVIELAGRLHVAPTQSVPQASLDTAYVGILNARPPDLAVGEIDQRPSVNVRTDEPVAYSIEVENRGRGSAGPVEVGLYVNERLFDLVEVDLLEAGARRLVNFTFTPEADQQSLVVALDPRGLLSETVLENNAAGWVLQAESDGFDLLPVPSLGLVPLLLALAAVAAAARRRRHG